MKVIKLFTFYIIVDGYARHSKIKKKFFWKLIVEGARSLSKEIKSKNRLGNTGFKRYYLHIWYDFVIILLSLFSLSIRHTHKRLQMIKILVHIKPRLTGGKWYGVKGGTFWGQQILAGCV